MLGLNALGFVITDGFVKGFPLKLLLIGSQSSDFFILGFVLHGIDEEKEEVLAGDDMMDIFPRKFLSFLYWFVELNGDFGFRMEMKWKSLKQE